MVSRQILISTKEPVPLLHHAKFVTCSPVQSVRRQRVPTLGQFLLRKRVLSLYRSVVRATNKIPSASSTRAEMKDFARAEFERNRGVNDETTIRYLVSLGKTEFERMERYVLEQAV